MNDLGAAIWLEGPSFGSRAETGRPASAEMWDMALAEHQHGLDLSEAGWYRDPDGEHNLRYFDGSGWTGHVTHYGPTPCDGCSDPAIDS